MSQSHDERSPAELEAINDDLVQSLARCREMLAECRTKLDAISSEIPAEGVAATSD